MEYERSVCVCALLVCKALRNLICRILVCWFCSVFTYSSYRPLRKFLTSCFQWSDPYITINHFKKKLIKNLKQPFVFGSTSRRPKPLEHCQKTNSCTKWQRFLELIPRIIHLRTKEQFRGRDRRRQHKSGNSAATDQIAGKPITGWLHSITGLLRTGSVSRVRLGAFPDGYCFRRGIEAVAEGNGFSSLWTL